MNASDAKIVLKLLKAIQDDWALTDENDADAHMVLVNADRDKRNDLKPLKTLVSQLEAEGLIKLDLKKSDPRGAKREFLDFFGEKESIPFVYFYEVTAKGRKFIAK